MMATAHQFCRRGGAAKPLRHPTPEFTSIHGFDAPRSVGFSGSHALGSVNASWDCARGLHRPAFAQAKTNCNNPNALGIARTVEADTTGGPGFGLE
jgi:hypothetical protein